MSMIDLRHVEVADVRRAAVDHWHEILRDLAPKLDAALGKAGGNFRNPRHVPCPEHGGKDGFRLFRDYRETGGGVCNTCGSFPDGLSLLMWVNGWRFTEALAAVADWLGIRPPTTRYSGRSTSMRLASSLPPPVVPQPASALVYRDGDADTRLRALIERIWSESIPILDAKAAAAQRYLKNRNIFLRMVADLEHALRFHPELEYRCDETGKPLGVHPAILGAITDNASGLVTLQRIYLTHDGRKAEVPSPKKMMPIPNGKTVRGACIKLGSFAGNAIDFSEGIETALAVRCATGRTVWSAVNATLLEVVDPPQRANSVCVWADADAEKKGIRRGEQAAGKLAERLARSGLRVQVFLPPIPLAAAEKVDWNDVWSRLRFDGFPSRLAMSAVA